MIVLRLEEYYSSEIHGLFTFLAVRYYTIDTAILLDLLALENGHENFKYICIIFLYFSSLCWMKPTDF